MSINSVTTASVTNLLTVTNLHKWLASYEYSEFVCHVHRGQLGEE